ncbi:MAG: hypothetical protein KC483_10005 [Nitrosarchaeum sp.]|nr:hypothetical protein [Nitrosarchaeum sp.]
MSISGGIKLFDKSKNLLVDGATISSSISGDASAEYAIDRSKITYFRSVGTDDSTQEILLIDWGEAKTIDRILLLDHNFKLFDVYYDSNGSQNWTAFTSAVGLDGAIGGGSISETTFADNTAYYEVDSVTAYGLRIRCTETQTTDAEKYLNQAIATVEIGTFIGFPTCNITSDRKLSIREVLNGRSSVAKKNEVFVYELILNEYPANSNYNTDITLIENLHDREDPFIIWPCGGRRGSTYFPYAARGHRLKDAIQVQILSPLSPIYSSGVYINPISINMTMRESE